MPKKLTRVADAPRSVVNDPRFSSMHNAPIFKKIQKDSNKIKVDERFQTVLTDDRFRAVPGAIDIYGRKTKKGAKSAAEKELNSFYQIDDSIPSTTDGDDMGVHDTATTTGKESKGKKPKAKEGVKAEDPESRLEYLNRLARGDVSGSSSDDDSEDEGKFSDVDSDDSDDDGALVEATDRNERGPLDMASDESEDEDGEEAHATCRLALMNCDWDSLKAQDLMSVLQSFCPTGKTVETVTVYPSDFGKEKMANEATHGPPKIWTGGYDVSDEEDDDSEGEGDDEENGEDDDDDEGYAGIAAIDQDVAPSTEKKGDKWKRANNGKNGKPTTGADKVVKEKISKADRKGDFKRLPGTIGIVLQDDLVSRGLNRDDDADADADDDSGGEDEGANYFDGDLSKGDPKYPVKGKKSNPSTKGKDKKATLERERFTGAGKGDEDGEGGFDEVALRAYELSKLKYYFAVAEISSVDAAEALMNQLDGVELGHSSMVFDLRFIPEDTSFIGRDVRDKCTEVGTDYQPPDFVVNALQHTTVQCSWDEGEKERERKLTNISQWRQLQESELLQYVASSDSDDDEEEEEEEQDSGEESDTGVSKTGKSKSAAARKQSAANLRRLLLGGGSDDDDSVAEDSDNDDTFFKSSSKAKGKKVKEVVEDTADAGFQDDFFMDDGEGLEEEETTKAAPIKSKKTSKKGQKGEEADMTFTYVPDAKQQLLEKKKEAEQNLDETPFETMQRRLTEKRKARKAAKKLLKSGGGSVGEEDEDVEEVAVKATGKKGKMAEKEREAATKAELELLLSDDDEGYDMRALHKQELEETKGPKGKRKSRSKKPKDADDAALQRDSTGPSGGDFELDLKDNRFARLLEGDSSFGIDRTSADFKETKAMKQIFGEQRSRREKGEADAAKGGQVQGQKQLDVSVSKVASSTADVDSLVTKLKRKFNEENGKTKQPRL